MRHIGTDHHENYWRQKVGWISWFKIVYKKLAYKNMQYFSFKVIPIFNKAFFTQNKIQSKCISGKNLGTKFSDVNFLGESDLEPLRAL